MVAEQGSSLTPHRQLLLDIAVQDAHSCFARGNIMVDSNKVRDLHVELAQRAFDFDNGLRCQASGADGRRSLSPLFEKEYMRDHSTLIHVDKMPTALTTSKRKFHDLLERMTTSPTELPPAPKRVRITPNSTVTSTTVRPVAIPRSRVASTIKSTTTTKLLGAERTQSPWSHDAFLARLSTFSELRHWTSKPEAVNEVAWARRGWVCDTTAVNRVACRGGCEQRLLVQLRSAQKDDEGREIVDSEDYTTDIDDGLVSKYEELIVDGHSEDCLWRDTGCSDDIYRMPIARPRVWIPELRARYSSFADVVKHGGDLPGPANMLHPLDLEKIKPLLPAGLIAISASDAAARDAETEPDVTGGEVQGDTQDINNGALAFALLGWRYTSKDQMPLAICDHCFRRLGLWLYTATSENGRKDTDQASNAKGTEDYEDDSMKLDLVENHRDYCPWVSGASQKQPGSLAGLSAWQVLQKSIENNASFEASKRHLDGGGQPAGLNDNVEPSRTPASEKSPEEIDREDKKRAQRLLDFTRSMGKRIGLWKKR
ncbi:hypothetical protein FH972_001634 [Carpinus fangiana]|uniref:C3HC-type domain-containing protein n=1 Tax=Carpinus fangiana TaxID=176857 RepID=A0A5N6QCD9_9ROSI|nr:hypothetical protein FH972_001634 [Carpinus fangiana]